MITSLFIVLGLGIATFIKTKKVTMFRRKALKNLGWIPALAFAIGVSVSVAGYEDGWLYEQMIELVVMGLFFFLPFSLVYRHFSNEQTLRLDYETDEFKRKAPKDFRGRYKIVERANERFGLNLTPEQMRLIVNSSFQMIEWKHEVEDMDNLGHDAIYEWYAGETGWLRAYLKAFSVQNIVSDFEYQKKVCLDSFDQIFKSTDMTKYNSIAECVWDINNRYYTNFDDNTFMIAYRMLQQNGRHYKLPTMQLIKNTSEIDNLMKAYDNASKTETTNNTRMQR